MSGKPAFGQRPPTRAPRQTEPGHESMEEMVEKALKRARVAYSKDQPLDEVLGFPYKVEFVIARRDGSHIPVKLMYQESSGSAEQKVPWHLIHLGYVKERAYDIPRCYLVLAGDGWTRKHLYTSEVFHRFIPLAEGVVVEDLGRFLARFGGEEGQ